MWRKGPRKKELNNMLRLNNLINFSLESIEEQYFDIDFSSLDVPIAVPTKA
jgi:hypothetical protein